MTDTVALRLHWSVTSHGQVTKVPGQAPAHYYRVFCRQPVQDDFGQGLSPHPETEASGNHKKLDKENTNYLMFTTQCTNDEGGRAVAMAMLPPAPTKPITLP